ncbi:MAG: alkaline phosphatase [Hyphomonadaceae bacterium]
MLIARRSLLTAVPLAVVAPRAAWANTLSHGVFSHGVASGDPLPDGFIIWTRFAHANEGRIAWEVAEDEAFARIVQRGEARAAFASDFCVKVDVRGLSPARVYFYRFLSASGPSLTGETRTAPTGGADSLTVAVFSCANMPFGYFNAYRHAAARRDIDLVLHTGDYIYEIQRGAYPSAEEAIPGRIIDPANETVTLSDYYQRYASYHTDADLLELRRTKPMSVVWDDHEIANDTWRDGAQAHHEPTEGRFLDRVAAATKAYFDWMPIRRPEARSARLYRSLDWGDLARIVLLDTRYIGRDRQIDYRSALMPQLLQGGADAAAVVAQFRRDVLDDPNRTMLGAAQESWFAETLADSKQRGQTWQIVTQQVVMGEQIAPTGLTRLLPDDISPGSRQWFAAGEQVSALGLPWNLDSWGGYPAARARFLAACAANANNAVVLGGDSHNCWINNLAAADGARLAAVEVAGGSVASPGFERSLSRAAPGEREALLRSANAHLAWCDLTNRGYAALRFTRETCTTEWHAFADVRTRNDDAPIVARLVSAASATAGPGGWVI